nr:O-antigen ligase family protein [Hydrogenovibrio sp. JE_KL2]
MISGILLSLLSGSRGGWLTMLLVFMTLVFLLPKIDRKFNYIIWGIVAALGVVLYLMWHELPVEKRILQTLNSIQAYMNGNAHTSLGYRFEMWKAAYWAFLEKPLFGWGFDNFNVYFQKYLNEGLVVGKLWGHPHNDYMLLLSEKGVLGFVIVLSVLLYPFVVMLKYARKAIQTKQLEKLSLALTGMVLIEALMEFMLSDQTITMKFQYHLYVVLILMIMSALWFYDTESSKIEEEIKDETRSS